MAQDHLSDNALRQRGGLRDCAGSFWEKVQTYLMLDLNFCNSGASWIAF